MNKDIVIKIKELSARERTALASNGSTRLYDSIKEENYETIDADVEMHAVCNMYNVPTQQITVTYNNKTVENYI
jgi:hypothetical protein